MNESMRGNKLNDLKNTVIQVMLCLSINVNKY